MSIREPKLDGLVGESGNAPERLLLLLGLALVVVYTLAPFDFSVSPGELIDRIREACRISSFDGPLKLAGHLIAFLALGIVISATYRRSLERWKPGRIVLLVLLFCGGLECSQLLEAPRHARLTDLLANAAGLSIGIMCASRWNRGRSARATLQGWIHRHRILFYTIILAAALGTWCAAALRPLFAGLELKWDLNDRLYFANESERNRPWLGEIRYVGIYGRALTAEQRQLAGNTLGRNREVSYMEKTNLLAGYDFMHTGTGKILPQGLLHSPDLAIDLPRNCANGEGNGILLMQPAFIASKGPASALTNAIASAGEFSVEAWIRAQNQSQNGPARIVSLSEDIWKRNFTLGQDWADLVFRVRNGVNGENGKAYELHNRDMFDQGLHQIIAIYDHGVSAVYKDGQVVPPVIDLREPTVYLGLGFGNWGRVAAGLLLTIAIALPITLLWPVTPRKAVKYFGASLITLILAGSPYAIVCLWTGGARHLELFFCLFTALLIAYPLGALFLQPTAVNRAGSALISRNSRTITAELDLSESGASEGVF
jgi:VanZ family protein